MREYDDYNSLQGFSIKGNKLYFSEKKYYEWASQFKTTFNYFDTPMDYYVDPDRADETTETSINPSCSIGTTACAVLKVTPLNAKPFYIALTAQIIDSIHLYSIYDKAESKKWGMPAYHLYPLEKHYYYQGANYYSYASVVNAYSYDGKYENIDKAIKTSVWGSMPYEISLPITATKSMKAEKKYKVSGNQAYSYSNQTYSWAFGFSPNCRRYSDFNKYLKK